MGALGITRRNAWPLAAFALALVFPKLAVAFGQDFYVSFGSRLLIMALLASSLNLLVGVGGMVSMGHAAFYGLGAYVVGIVSAQWAGTIGEHALLAWPLAMLASGALALGVGAVSLRTQGVYFIMITLAFAQMIYYVFVSLKAFGGDDGMSLAQRSRFAGLDLGSDVTFYYVVLALFAAALVFLGRLGESRFGMVLRGIKDNEARMESFGFATYHFKLAAFVIAGTLAGLAGALMANQNSYVSPNMMHWEQSGVALVMVVLGGLGSLWGGLAGAAAFLLLEEVLSGFTRHWQIALGMIMLGVVFFAPRGVAGLFTVKR
jgi:branched-chain amino acid transport system permease protein